MIQMGRPKTGAKREPTAMIRVRIETSNYKRIKRAAKKTGKTPSQFIRDVLNRESVKLTRRKKSV